MQNSVFLEDEFFLLLVISIIVPVGMYGYMMWKRFDRERAQIADA